MARKLQEEIKQTKPFAILEEEAALNISRTADRLESSMRLLLKPHGLTPTQYNALRILRGAGPEGLTCSELGVRLVSMDPDITRLLDRLEKHDMVKRRRDEHDRRVVYTVIAEGGLEKLKDLDPLVVEGVKSRLGHMSREKLTLLIDLMEEAREKI